MAISYNLTTEERLINQSFFRYDSFNKADFNRVYKELTSLEKSVVLDFRRDRNIKQIISNYYYNSDIDWNEFVDLSIIDIRDYVSSKGYVKSNGINHFLDIIGENGQDNSVYGTSWCGNEGGGTTTQQIACAIIIIILIIAICL